MSDDFTFTFVFSACGLMKNPDIVSWNCLLDRYVKSGDLEEARMVFDEMSERDVVSWTTMLVGYVNSGLLDSSFGFV